MKRGASSARASGAPQLGLFDFDFRANAPQRVVFERGEIMRQTAGVHGFYDVAFPFWQVRGEHPDSRPGRRLWLCHAVPFSAYAGEIGVFDEALITPTGLRWRVPESDEVERWARDSWGINTFAARLNRKVDGSTFLYHSTWEDHGRPGVLAEKEPSVGYGVYVHLPSFPEEAELIALLGDRPWQFGRVKRHDDFLQTGVA